MSTGNRYENFNSDFENEISILGDDEGEKKDGDYSTDYENGDGNGWDDYDNAIGVTEHKSGDQEPGDQEFGNQEPGDQEFDDQEPSDQHSSSPKSEYNCNNFYNQIYNNDYDSYSGMEDQFGMEDQIDVEDHFKNFDFLDIQSGQKMTKYQSILDSRKSDEMILLDARIKSLESAFNESNKKYDKLVILVNNILVNNILLNQSSGKQCDAETPK